MAEAILTVKQISHPSQITEMTKRSEASTQDQIRPGTFPAMNAVSAPLNVHGIDDDRDITDGVQTFRNSMNRILSDGLDHAHEAFDPSREDDAQFSEQADAMLADSDDDGFGEPKPFDVEPSPLLARIQLTGSEVKRQRLPDLAEDSCEIAKFSKSQFELGLRNTVHALYPSRSSSLKMPWERGFFAAVMGGGQSSSSSAAWMETSNVPLPRLPAESKVLSVSALPVVKRVVRGAIKRKMQAVKDHVTEDELRDRVLRTWRKIIEFSLPTTSVGNQLLDLHEGNHGDELINSTIADVFREKSVATLFKRSGSFLQYANSNFMLQKTPEEVLGMSEKIVYSYLCQLRTDQAAATKANSFRQAIGFMVGCLGIPSSFRRYNLLGSRVAVPTSMFARDL